MDIVCILIPADGVHIGIYAFSDAKAVFFQGIALPFGKGVDYLRMLFILLPDPEGDRTLIAVQVVIETGIRIHKQRSRNAG